MNYNKALVAGVIGAIVMTIIMAMARAMGMPVNLEMMLGTMMGGPPSAAKWVMGDHPPHRGRHLRADLCRGVRIPDTPRRLAGRLGFGVMHTLFSGLLLAMMPAMHPLVPEMMPAPGAFMANLGMMGVGAFFILHLIYGAIVGAIYGPVVHGPPGASVDATCVKAP